MKMKKIIWILFLSLLAFSINAQQTNTTISGKVTDTNGKTLEGVAIVLRSEIDSTYISGCITDTCGLYTFSGLKKQKYLLEFSMLGFKKQIHHLIPKTKQNFLSAILEEDAKQLSEIVVTAKHTFMKMNVGTTTFDKEAMVLGTQGNLLDALRSLPGVLVNEDGSIILNGQPGIKVLLNGKSTYLAGDKLVNYLRSLPLSSIKDIQLIHSPSAKNDAEGKAGLIDIRTEKVTTEGWTLQVNTGYQQSTDGKWNTGGRLTYQKNKFGLFLDYSYNGGKYKSVLDISREYDAAMCSRQQMNVFQESRMKDRNQSNWGRLGMNYDFNNRLSFDVSISGSLFDKRIPANTSTFLQNTNMVIDSTLYTRSFNHTRQRTLSGGALLSYKDEKSRMADVSFDYLIHKHDGMLFMNNEMRTSQEQIMRRDTLNGDMNSDICMYSTQVNWGIPLLDQFKFDTGVKITWIKLENKALYENQLSGVWIQNEAMSNRYEYNENINAAYTQFSGRIGKFNLVAGVRLEQTKISGKQYLLDANQSNHIYKNSYFHLFPSFTLQYEFSETGNSVSILYNKRIVRPNYGDLSPFNYIWDDYTRSTGNPDLKAELTDNIELVYIYKKMYRATLFFSSTKAPIMQSIELLADNTAIVYPKNFKDNRKVGVRLDAGDLIQTKVWRLSANATLYRNLYTWEEFGKTIEKKLFTPSISITNQFVFPKGVNAELSGFYNGRMAFGQATISPHWSVSAAVQKKLWQDGLVFRLFANDLFQSNRQNLTLDLSGSIGKASTKQFNDFRCVGFSLSINFNQGKQTKKSTRNISIDQSKRINL